ncbi:acetyl-CoA C-acyltransferase [bacterium]|nr:MAG: acetyl-CoA C-acyltransferase [bacterium]
MSPLRDAVIVDGLRTPIGRYGGALSAVRPDDLAARTIAALVERTHLDPASVDDVYFGAANQAGEDNRNVARMALLLAGLPIEVPGATVNRLCGSGMQALNSAAMAIQTGVADTVIAGGVESMSRAPYVMLKPEAAYGRAPDLFDTTLGWRMVNPNMPERWTISLGQTAEVVAEKYGVSREDQDRFAVESQHKAKAAQDAGRFDAEIIPVTIVGRKGETRVEHDEHPRPQTTLEALAKLKPAFKAGGTVTAGNSSGINDGACALLVMEGERARAAGIQPLGRYVAGAAAGVDPSEMGMGVVPAARRALALAGLGVDDIGVFEINEAFASQSVASVRQLGIDPLRVNVNGGAIALGHPLGCSGARLAATLLHEMARRKVRYGLAAMCIGVGQGIATVFERVS